MKVSHILKLESFVFFLASLWAYFVSNSSWLIFIIFILAPDIFMIGYLKGSKVGAKIYNLGHTYVIPILLFCIYLLAHVQILLPISIIWFAHISMDRMLGFGLKLDTGFNDTHLGKITK